MDSQQRARVAARFARLWKRDVRAEEGRRHRQENLAEREEEFAYGISKRTMMLIITAAVAVALVCLLVYRASAS